MHQIDGSFSPDFDFPDEGAVLSRKVICALCGFPVDDVRKMVTQNGRKIHADCADGRV